MAKRKPYRFPLYVLIRLFAALIYIMPRTWAMVTARCLGCLAYYGIRRQREMALDNLKRAFAGEKSDHEIRDIAKRVFEHLAMTAAEVLQFPKLDFEKASKLIDLGDAFQVYDDILREGKGLISVTAHLGNWELLAGIFGLKGYQGGVLARRIYYEPYNRWIVGLRNSVKVPTIYRDRSSRQILDILSRNQIVGMLPDQDIDSLKGVFVDFFNRPAFTPEAPVKMALASGAPIVPNFLVRQPDGRYRWVMGEIIRPSVQTTREDAIREGTERWMHQFEKIIQKHPEQWGWMHNRWKTGKWKREEIRRRSASVAKAEVA